MGRKNKYRDSWKERQITADEKRLKEELENELEEVKNSCKLGY